MRVMVQSLREIFQISLEKKNINVKSSYELIDEFCTCIPRGDVQVIYVHEVF